MAENQATLPIGQQVSLTWHFDALVVLEAARPLGRRHECGGRLPDGSLDEAVISEEEDCAPVNGGKLLLANAEKARLLVESARIHLVFLYGWQSAVSLCDVRTLPRQNRSGLHQNAAAVVASLFGGERPMCRQNDDGGAGEFSNVQNGGLRQFSPFSTDLDFDV